MMEQTYKVVMVAGSVKYNVASHMTFKEAEDYCEYYNWEIAPDGPGGFVWDLEIEEE